MFGITQMFSIKILNSPKEAPIYTPEKTTPLEIKEVLVVGRGMEGGKPSIDIQLEDKNGKKYVAMTTGTLLETLGGAIKGKRELDTGENKAGVKH